MFIIIIIIIIIIAAAEKRLTEGIASLSQVEREKPDKVRMIRASGGADERQNLLAAFKRSRSISQQPVRSPPFCRLVIHLDNITAMKRSTHSAGAHASHDTNGQKKKKLL